MPDAVVRPGRDRPPSRRTDQGAGAQAPPGPADLPAALTGLLAGDPLEVAPALLGALFSATDAHGTVSVRLTEVEAYRGETDPGSHAFKGRTARNATMFEAGGVIYVYLTYGMHHCLNIVTGPEGDSRAVLLRAGEVTEGLELARRRRPKARTDRDLARGPGRLCAALGLTRDDDGAALGPPGTRVSLTLPDQPVDPARVRTGPRTGVSGPGGSEAFPWRFWCEGEPTVSPYKPASPRRSKQ